MSMDKPVFYLGAGVQELLSDYAMSSISDRDFKRERLPPNDWRLNSKEELMYYRIFKAHVGRQEQERI
jgi:asparagine synthase (glutamine-hydrolysing)